MPYDPERHGPRRVVGPGFHARVRDAVRQVPAGAVTTYGDVAASLGLRAAARQVGYALSASSDPDLPWHRVVNSRGEVSARADGLPSDEQIRLLADDDVAVDERGRVIGFGAIRHAFD